MWFIHEILARALLFMVLLMIGFAIVQSVRRQPVGKMFFTGVLYAGGLTAITGIIGVLGLILQGGELRALHLAYGAVAVLTLPIVYSLERSNSNPVRAMRLYLVGFIVLLICVWRAIETALE
jgi:ABC-type Fe3+-siderophore transport system permease subunit